MTPNYANMTQGANVEHLFANSIETHSLTFKVIRKALGITEGKPKIKVVGGRHRKADVVMTFKDATQLRCSVKSFTGSGYNHIERRKLDEFCRRNQILKPDQAFLEKLFLRKGKDTRNTQLVMAEEREQVRRIFSEVEVGVSALIGNDHPQILVLFSVGISKFHIYDMDKQVIPLVRGTHIGFTPRSSNVEIGDYIVLQRKGSAKEKGGRDNDVQMKMKVGKFFNEIEPLCWYQL